MTSLWAFYKKNFIALFGISLVMALITQYISTTIDLTELKQITDPEELLMKMRDFVRPVIIISVISLFFSTILHHYILYHPIDSENSVIRSIIGSLRFFVPYLITMVLFAFFSSFALLLGFVMLVIGLFFAALYILTIYLFILPVMLAEGPNIANTIARTISLAHRKFWSNIGWTAALILLMIVISLVLSGIVLLPFTGSFLKVFINPADSASLIDLAKNPVYIILNSIVSAIIYPALPIFAFILYLNGRAQEEIPSTEDYTYGNDQPDRSEEIYPKSLPGDDDDTEEKS
jgi:hypothetical protein